MCFHLNRLKNGKFNTSSKEHTRYPKTNRLRANHFCKTIWSQFRDPVPLKGKVQRWPVPYISPILFAGMGPACVVFMSSISWYSISTDPMLHMHMHCIAHTSRTWSHIHCTFVYTLHCINTVPKIWNKYSQKWNCVTSQILECGNWKGALAVSFLGIYKSDVVCSVGWVTVPL